MYAERPQVHAPIRGDAEPVGRLVAGDDDRGGHVDVHDRDHLLRVRVAHDAVRRRRRDRATSRVVHLLEPGVRVLRRDLGHRRQQVAHLAPVLLGLDPERAATGDVAHREGEPRLEHLVRDLRGWNGASNGNGFLLGVAVRPRRSLPRLLEPAHGVERLRARDDRDVGAARRGWRWPRRPRASAAGRCRRCPCSPGRRGRSRAARRADRAGRRTASSCSRRLAAGRPQTGRRPSPRRRPPPPRRPR